MKNPTGDSLRTLIVEDNLESLKELKLLLDDIEHIELAGEARTGKEAVAIIDQLKPDLLFLDIQLPGIDGFEVLRQIHCRPLVIFVTAYHHYAVKAFEVNGIDYLLKPIAIDRLRQAVDRVIRLKKKLNPEILDTLKELIQQSHRQMHFSVKSGDQILIIPREEVYYFKAEDKYVFLYTDHKRFFYPYNLKELLATLDPDMFCRVNRSCIVSLRKIKKLKRGVMGECKLVLNDSGATAIKVSQNHIPELKDKLNIRIKF